MPLVRPAEASRLLEADGPAARLPDVAGRDAIPRADVVVVFPRKPNPMVRALDRESQTFEAQGLRPPTDSERNRMEGWQIKRQCTISSMSDAGLISLPFYSRSRDQVFVKLAAEESLLRVAAEASRYRLELRPEYLSAFAEYKSDCPGRRELKYTDRRALSHLYKVHREDGQEDDDELEFGSSIEDEAAAEKQRLRRRSPRRPPSVFRAVDRIRLIDHIVRSVDPDCAGVDVGQLMHDGDLWSYFPLHENGKLIELDKDWFQCFAWGRHVDKVRDYFGERIAMYFLFASHFHHWLCPAAAMGLAFWWLDNLIDGGSADNWAVLPFCAGACVWCAVFMHFWRRSAAEKALRWGTAGLRREAEPTRAEFYGVSCINPVTGRVDRYYPWSERIWKVIFSYTVIAVAVVLMLAALSLLMALRHIFARTGDRLSFQVINAILVDIMNGVLGSIARRLTDAENHRSQSEYAQHLLAKTVVFKFVNCYASLYYIAFFKEHSHLFGMPMACVNDDCLSDLSSQLAIFMITRLALQNFFELFLPYLLAWYRSLSQGYVVRGNFTTFTTAGSPDLPRAEREALREEHDLCEDMDELLILYGYATLFVVACPWAPLLALVSSVVQCLLDQKKLVLLYRRPFPLPAANNEPWDSAFDVVSMIACITNAGVAVFATESLDSWLNQNRVLLFMSLEHLALLARLGAEGLYPSPPTSVEVLRSRQEAVVHKHFDLGGEDEAESAETSSVSVYSLPMRGSVSTQSPAPLIYDSASAGAEEDDEGAEEVW